MKLEKSNLIDMDKKSLKKLSKNQLIELLLKKKKASSSTSNSQNNA